MPPIDPRSPEGERKGMSRYCDMLEQRVEEGLIARQECRECGGGLNCQHCHPYQLPIDRHRIAQLETALTLIVAGEVDSGGNIQPRADAMQIAFKALYPNG